MTSTTAARPLPPRAIPGPRGLPLLGSSLDLLRDPLGTYERARRTHGDVVRFVVGPPGRRVVLHMGLRARPGPAGPGRPRPDQGHDLLHRGRRDVRGCAADQRRGAVAPAAAHHPAAVHPPAHGRLRRGDGRGGDGAGRILGARGRGRPAGRPPPRDDGLHPAGDRAAACSAPTSTPPSARSAPPSVCSTATSMAGWCRRSAGRRTGRPRPTGAPPGPAPPSTRSWTRSSAGAAAPARPRPTTSSAGCWRLATPTPATDWTTPRCASRSCCSCSPGTRPPRPR